ncbi:MAG: hypothetical protein JL50_20615 [Peptococcaceae bacterium BICA1-7]|nr:MAG: hypothetical protein JL50_20615 [Peptococcaceae bacterium BICA1-7]HBV98485.1 hypothetical protein [Desulfotomaculum sp.]
MLPIQISTIQNFLLHRGYKNYTVGRMKTWDLIVAYSFEKKQTDNIYLPIRPVSRSSASASSTPSPDRDRGSLHKVDTYV